MFMVVAALARQRQVVQLGHDVGQIVIVRGVQIDRDVVVGIDRDIERHGGEGVGGENEDVGPRRAPEEPVADARFIARQATAYNDASRRRKHGKLDAYNGVA